MHTNQMINSGRPLEGFEITLQSNTTTHISGTCPIRLGLWKLPFTNEYWYDQCHWHVITTAQKPVDGNISRRKHFDITLAKNCRWKHLSTSFTPTFRNINAKCLNPTLRFDIMVFGCLKRVVRETVFVDTICFDISNICWCQKQFGHCQVH